MKRLAPLLKALGPALTPLPSARFDSANGERALLSALRSAVAGRVGQFLPRRIVGGGRADRLSGTDAEGQARRAGAAGARQRRTHFMAIDAATRRNLELTETLSGARGGSLLAGDRPHA